MKITRKFDNKKGILTLTCDINEDVSDEKKKGNSWLIPTTFSVSYWKKMCLNFLIEDSEDSEKTKFNFKELEKSIIADFCGFDSVPLVKREGKITGMKEEAEQ